MATKLSKYKGGVAFDLDVTDGGKARVLSLDFHGLPFEQIAGRCPGVIAVDWSYGRKKGKLELQVDEIKPYFYNLWKLSTGVVAILSGIRKSMRKMAPLPGVKLRVVK